MRQIVEHGMARRLKDIWVHRRPQCPESHNAQPIPVVIQEFSPALLIIFCGCIISLFGMFVEIFTDFRSRSALVAVPDDIVTQSPPTQGSLQDPESEHNDPEI